MISHMFLKLSINYFCFDEFIKMVTFIFLGLIKSNTQSNPDTKQNNDRQTATKVNKLETFLMQFLIA